MKYKLDIQNHYLETEVTIQAKQLDTEIIQLIDYLNHNQESVIYARYEERNYKVDFNEVTRIFAQDKYVYIKVKNGHAMQCDLRLYQLEQMLQKDFIRISKSELINKKLIDYFEMDFAGVLKISFIDKDYSYSSRRYLKDIKEKLKV